MRLVRVGLSLVAGTVVVLVVLTVGILLTGRRASDRWAEFSIGPPSGRSASIGTDTLRSDGITLKVLLSTAYDVPTARVIGPSWLGQTRYAVKAAVRLDESDSFRAVLQQELKNRLHLETHVELRPFEVFVLTATAAPRLERTEGRKTRIWISDGDVKLLEVTMAGLAGALQSILGKPVIDETGITGWHNLQFAWDEDRVRSVSAVLHDQFGLQLSPAQRNLEALVVDSIRRDAALVLLEQIGRVTSVAPSSVRRGISELLTIR